MQQAARNLQHEALGIAADASDIPLFVILELETRKTEWDTTFARLIHRATDAPTPKPSPGEVVAQMALAWVKVEISYLYTKAQSQRGLLLEGEPIVIAGMSELGKWTKAYQLLTGAPDHSRIGIPVDESNQRPHGYASMN